MKKQKTKTLKAQIAEAKKTDPELQKAFEGAMNLAEWGFKCEETLQNCKDVSDQIFSHKFDLVQALNKANSIKEDQNKVYEDLQTIISRLQKLDTIVNNFSKKKWYQFWR
jgi:DNA repair exonuclease SbcCD ATPase subunit